MRPSDLDSVIMLYSNEPSIQFQEWENKQVLGKVLRDRASYVACDGKAIAGAIFTEIGLRGVYRHVVVAPTLRRNGIGTQLFKLAINKVIAAGVHRHHTFVLPNNTSSIDMVDRLGFRQDAKGNCIMFELDKSEPFRGIALSLETL
jgi:L-amino acid N-acyltransferase YncA